MSISLENYTVASDYYIRVENKSVPGGIFSIEPLFEHTDLSDKGKKIATNSMIEQERSIGCPVCASVRPVELFKSCIGEFAVCEICTKNCPECSSEKSITADGESVICSSCELRVDL